MFKFCFEGIDGCGKDTQISLLRKRLKKEGFRVATVKHPGYTAFGAELRRLLVSPDAPQPKSDLARRLLFWADFLETAKNLPDADVSDADVVIFNRHPRYSNYAYGAASGSPESDLLALDLTCFLPSSVRVVPNLVIVLDVPGEEAFARLLKRGKTLTSVEANGAAFLERARQAYLELPRLYSEATVVDGSRPAENVAADVWKIASKHLPTRESKVCAG